MMPEIVSGESSANVSAFETQEVAHRVLLVADEVFRGSDLARELRSHLDSIENTEIFVISTATAHSAVDQELGDVDRPAREARERLDQILGELRKQGFRASGEVGDADPMVAVGDGLVEFRADEIVVVTHIDSEREHAERGIWDRLSTDFHPPATLLKVAHPDADGASSGVLEAEHAPAHEKTEEEVIRETRNFPPLRRLDVAGILVGFVGTVALGMLAVAVGNQDPGELSGGAAVVLLIAIGAFLLNVANIIGLLFFESVRYTGIWEKFFARTSIVFTTIGVAVALFIWLT
ncbi:MAG: hypothetical protein BGO23_10890 [Solirubrobacterales bacterium 67-14]|nr:MAG: hypothetical protein BGO23_10890 [Solirubrobacterales bacterium 67-14]